MRVEQILHTIKAVFLCLFVSQIQATPSQDLSTSFSTPEEIRSYYEQSDYSKFVHITNSTIEQSDLEKGFLLLGEANYKVNNPLIVDASTPVLFIHGVDRMRSILTPLNKGKPLIKVRDSRYINISNIRFNGFNQYSGINLLTEGDSSVVVDVSDSFIEKGAFIFNAPGTYQLQGNYFTGRGKVSSQIVLNNDLADLFVYGGNITNSGMDKSFNVTGNSHINIQSGRFRIFATGVQRTRGVADFRIDSQTTVDKPHQIINVRSEGNNGKKIGGSAFIYVPPSEKKIDIDIINSAGSWKLSGVHKSTFAYYNAAGTLRLIGNTSASGVGQFVNSNIGSGFKILAVVNTLSENPKVKSDNQRFYVNNIYAGKIIVGRFKLPPFFKVDEYAGETAGLFPINLNIDIPKALKKPKILKPFPEMTNVKKYGVKGDGVTDDTVAIQHVFNNKHSIYFPAGHYLINESIKFNVDNKYDHGAGGFIAGEGSEKVIIERVEGGAVFGTQGMAYATMQGLTFKSKRYFVHNDSVFPAAVNFEFTKGTGHATQSNSIYDVKIENANIGIGIGNKSQQQCSENLFVGLAIENVNMAISIGSYNALANVFVNLTVFDANNVIGHGEGYSGGTWSIVGGYFSGIKLNVFKFLNSSDGVYFFDDIKVSDSPLFTTNDTGASFNIFFNKSELKKAGFYIKSAGGVFLNDSVLSEFKIHGHGVISDNYIINNSNSDIVNELNVNHGSYFLGK
ncbi:MAG: hypothetical protein methR_P1474 [Methyloprofundus sp.]|nr:MAG: hypothetical protein methR_P1474 [Methyloprofundus sp.]